MPRGKGGRGLRVTSDMPESEFVYLDFVKANVVIKKVLHHFEVTAEPDTLARTAKLDTSTITVEAKDKNDEDVTIPDNTLLDFALDAIGMQLGNLIAPNGSQAKSLAGISYGDARVGKVKYVANGDFADSTQQVKITVSNSEDASRKGSDSLAVQCHILPPRYAQDGGDWGDDIYDTTNDDIATLGCALSSEAFVMTVFGDTINPGELNTWMKEKTGKEGGFYGRKVNWYAMEKHTPGIMDITYYQKDMWTKDNKLDSTQITNPAVLDEPLSECRLIIVRVYNKDTGNEHWVVVTGRENGRYTIMDPGKGEDYLDGYGAFWNYVVITKL